MALLTVQQFGQAPTAVGSPTNAGWVLAVAVVVTVVAGLVLFVREWHRLGRSSGARLADEAEMWLRDQPPRLGAGH